MAPSRMRKIRFRWIWMTCKHLEGNDVVVKKPKSFPFAHFLDDAAGVSVTIVRAR